MNWKRLTRWMYDRPLKNGVLLKDRYKIEKCIGMGGYGIIYQCMDTNTQKSYVLKQLRPSKARKVKERGRFQQEAELIGSINHQQIPNLLDFFTIDRQAYYVMSKIDGANVEDVLFFQRQTFTELEALKLLNKLLNIVKYLHEHLIFHSDLRPPNIIIRDQDVYLIDFGLAKKLTTEEIVELKGRRQDDFFDLGECLLFLLYSQYKEKPSKNRSWLEELTLDKETEVLIKRLLGISEKYQHTNGIQIDLDKAIKSVMSDKVSSLL